MSKNKKIKYFVMALVTMIVVIGLTHVSLAEDEPNLGLEEEKETLNKQGEQLDKAINLLGGKKCAELYVEGVCKPMAEAIKEEICETYSVKASDCPEKAACCKPVGCTSEQTKCEENKEYSCEEGKWTTSPTDCGELGCDEETKKCKIAQEPAEPEQVAPTVTCEQSSLEIKESGVQTVKCTATPTGRYEWTSKKGDTVSQKSPTDNGEFGVEILEAIPGEVIYSVTAKVEGTKLESTPVTITVSAKCEFKYDPSGTLGNHRYTVSNFNKDNCEFTISHPVNDQNPSFTVGSNEDCDCNSIPSKTVTPDLDEDKFSGWENGCGEFSIFNDVCGSDNFIYSCYSTNTIMKWKKDSKFWKPDATKCAGNSDGKTRCVGSKLDEITAGQDNIKEAKCDYPICDKEDSNLFDSSTKKFKDNCICSEGKKDTCNAYCWEGGTCNDVVEKCEPECGDKECDKKENMCYKESKTYSCPDGIALSKILKKIYDNGDIKPETTIVDCSEKEEVCSHKTEGDDETTEEITCVKPTCAQLVEQEKASICKYGCKEGEQEGTVEEDKKCCKGKESCKEPELVCKVKLPPIEIEDCKAEFIDVAQPGEDGRIDIPPKELSIKVTYTGKEDESKSKDVIFKKVECTIAKPNIDFTAADLPDLAKVCKELKNTRSCEVTIKPELKNGIEGYTLEIGEVKTSVENSEMIENKLTLPYDASLQKVTINVIKGDSSFEVVKDSNKKCEGSNFEVPIEINKDDINKLVKTVDITFGIYQKDTNTPINTPSSVTVDGKKLSKPIKHGHIENKFPIEKDKTELSISISNEKYKDATEKFKIKSGKVLARFHLERKEDTDPSKCTSTFQKKCSPNPEVKGGQSSIQDCEGAWFFWDFGDSWGKPKKCPDGQKCYTLVYNPEGKQYDAACLEPKCGDNDGGDGRKCLSRKDCDTEDLKKVEDKKYSYSDCTGLKKCCLPKKEDCKATLGNNKKIRVQGHDFDLEIKSGQDIKAKSSGTVVVTAKTTYKDKDKNDVDKTFDVPIKNIQCN